MKNIPLKNLRLQNYENVEFQPYFASTNKQILMIIFKTEADIQNYLSDLQLKGKSIGFVPTMGALHAGHGSLVIKAKDETDCVVCSVFVNPTQFNDKVDFEKYPITREADLALLLEWGCQVAFFPDVEDVYPNGMNAGSEFDFGYLDTILEGEKRPGHFQGVGQVVSRLLDIVKPSDLFMGQKDFQQCMVIQKLLELKENPYQTKLHICPTVRDADGLAMSSRNKLLSEPQRTLAATIYQCLVSIQSKQSTDSFSVVQRECLDLLTNKDFIPEYVSIADANNLSLLEDFDAKRKMVALIAAKIGSVRLIDNLLLN